MRRAISFVAALLSVGMASASVGASACDLSCALKQSTGDCRAMAPAAGHDESMAGDSELNMGSDIGSSGANRDMAGMRGIDATEHRLPCAEMLTTGTKPQCSEMGAAEQRRALEHPKTLPSCHYETCSQTSISASPPRTDYFRFQASRILGGASHLSQCSMLSGTLRIRRAVSFGLDPLHLDSLVTILRI